MRVLWMFVECLPSAGGNIRVYATDDVIRDLDIRDRICPLDTKA